jgi:two-component system chemotaxis response regulator CheY
MYEKINPSKKAFIIDDCVDMQELLALLLQSQGYETNCTSNGQDALDLLNSAEILPDLILLDLRMPVMDGFGFIDLKKQCSKLKDIPIIVMTAESIQSEIDLLKNESTLSQILVKPLNMRLLIEAVNRTMLLH